MASDGVKPSAGKRREADLPHQAKNWATPSARDWKSGKASRKTLTRNSRPLNEQVLNEQAMKEQTGYRPFLLASVIAKAGADTSNADLTLNPVFVEALIGWPIGWTGFGSVATEWCRWLPRMRGELSRLALSMPGADTR
jgi:hypothetical protein